MGSNLSQEQRGAESYAFLQKICKSRATLGQMENIGSAKAVIVSGPGKSPPVFNLILGTALKNDVAVAMVFMPGQDQANQSRLSWEADYALNLGKAMAAKKDFLVILRDDKVPGHVQKLEMKLIENKQYPYKMLTVQQFLEEYCASSQHPRGKAKRVASDGVGVHYISESHNMQRTGRVGMSRCEGYFHSSGFVNQGVRFNPNGDRNLWDSQDDMLQGPGYKRTGRKLLSNGGEASGTWESQPLGSDGKWPRAKQIA